MRRSLYLKQDWRLGVSSAPEKPRWVLVGFQTDKSGNQERNAAIFDHCNLTSMQVCLLAGTTV